MSELELLEQARNDAWGKLITTAESQAFSYATASMKEREQKQATPEFEKLAATPEYKEWLDADIAYTAALVESEQYKQMLAEAREKVEATPEAKAYRHVAATMTSWKQKQATPEFKKALATPEYQEWERLFCLKLR